MVTVKLEPIRITPIAMLKGKMIGRRIEKGKESRLDVVVLGEKARLRQGLT